MKAFATGSAGFIGCHLAEKLIVNGHEVIGIGCTSDYYDVSLKEVRLARLKKHNAFTEVCAPAHKAPPLESRPIDTFNHGNMERDFIFVEDVVEGIFRLLGVPPKIDETWDAKKTSPMHIRYWPIPYCQHRQLPL